MSSEKNENALGQVPRRWLRYLYPTTSSFLVKTQCRCRTRGAWSLTT